MTDYEDQLKQSLATVASIHKEARDTKFSGQVRVSFSFSDGGVAMRSTDVAIKGNSLPVVMGDFMAQKAVRLEKKKSTEVA